jgi:hypothetical protein
MLKNTKQAALGRSPYSRPECNILEIKTEGVLCFSPTGSSADKLTLGDELTDYEQIY